MGSSPRLWAFSTPLRARALTVRAALLAVLAALGACQLPGFVAANFWPREKVNAAYEPIDQKTLVFVDDPRGAVPSIQLLGLIAQQAAADLKEEGVIAEFVPPSAVDGLRLGEPDFASWPVDRIGQRVGAGQVIYVLIDAFDAKGDGQELRKPIAAARLKVVDVGTGKRLFPAQGEHGVSSTLFFKQPPLDAGSHGRDALIARTLAQRLGRDIARQFYDHEQREVGSGFED